MLQPLTMSAAAEAGDLIENRTFDQISIGDSASLTRTLSRDDMALFAVMSGDVNPAHFDEHYAEGSIFHRIIAHGMWGGALVSAVLGTRLPELAAKRAPAKRLISIEDVGAAVGMLATDYAKLITGETVYVDGGYQIMG